MNQKGFTNVILVVIIVAVIAVAGYFIFVKRWDSQQTPTLLPSTTQTPTPQTSAPAPKDETENWKTYRNEVYGIEFKYPDHLLLDAIDYKNPESTPKRGIDPNSVPALYLVVNLSFPENANHYRLYVEKTKHTTYFLTIKLVGLFLISMILFRKNRLAAATSLAKVG